MSTILQNDLNFILASTRDLWEEVRGKRIFITGGTGFFGRWLLESFAHANDALQLHSQALVLTRNRNSFQMRAPHLATHPAIRFHDGDVRDFDFPDGTFSHVIHAATEANARLNAENPLLMFETIVTGTWRVLDFAMRSGARKFLLASSGAVYGRQPSSLTQIPEDYRGAPDPLDPRSAYGEGKRAAELLCTLYAARHGLETRIARCFAFVGPFLPVDRHYAVGNFIQDALNGGPVVVLGDGSARRSYLYASDLVVWLWTILFRGPAGAVYNVGSDYDLTIRELAMIVAGCAGGTPVKICGIKDARSEPERYVPDVSRARTSLGLELTTDLQNAVSRTMQHIREERGDA